MNLRLALWTLVVVVAVAGASRLAHAQAQGEVTIGYQGLPYKAPGETQTGIQVSDGVLLHVGAGAEGGYDSNVFYTDTDPSAAAIYRATIFGELTNATRTGLAKALSFDARAGLQYRRYQFTNTLPGNAAESDYANAWMPTAGLALSAGTGQLGFGLADTFARIEDPPYASGVSIGHVITRYNNQASIEGRWSPGGGRLTTMLRYTNMIDIFDEVSGYSYANSNTNLLMLDAAWKWLPKTAIFVNAQQGIIFYLNDSAATVGKESSYPLRVTAGLRGLLTERTSAVLSLGYNNAFVSGGATSTSGFWGSSFAELSFTLRPSDLSRIVAGYRHDFQNSV
ncbi:MAG TPA: hypothetical protein VN903_13620, partial [Polyangia bacterium]|nr:hypothetical protein [Polyangia bacterium]